jgi:hypothetical protein
MRVDPRPTPQPHRCAVALLLLGLATACAADEAIRPAAGPVGHELELLPGQTVVARRTGIGTAVFDAQVLTLHNRGPFSFPFVLESSVPWLSFKGAQNGMLAAGASTKVALVIEVASAPTDAGRHLAEMRVLNAVTFHRELAVEIAWVVGTSAKAGPSGN